MTYKLFCAIAIATLGSAVTTDTCKANGYAYPIDITFNHYTQEIEIFGYTNSPLVHGKWRTPGGAVGQSAATVDPYYHDTFYLKIPCMLNDIEDGNQMDLWFHTHGSNAAPVWEGTMEFVEEFPGYFRIEWSEDQP